MIRRPPRSPLFPYPRLFRSAAATARAACAAAADLARRAHHPARAAIQPIGAEIATGAAAVRQPASARDLTRARRAEDRKSTRLNSSHQIISYAVFCLKKKKT